MLAFSATAASQCFTTASPVNSRPARSTAARRSGAVQHRRRGSVVGVHANVDGDRSAAHTAKTTTATRREAFALGAATAALALMTPAEPAVAAYGADAGGSGDSAASKTFVTYYGAASPPATYGTTGGTVKDKAKYSYQVPSDWIEEPTTKVEKGAGGQDSRFVPPDGRGKVKAYCITLNRAGQDGAAFELTSQALSGISGADSNFQDAIATGKVTSDKISKDGQNFLIYDIEATDHYGVSVTIDNTGRLFAFLIVAPERTYATNKATYAKMLDSFKTYESASQFV